jgi:hypothetical protein
MLAGYALAVQQRGDPFRQAFSAQCFNIFVLQPSEEINQSLGFLRSFTTKAETGDRVAMFLTL